MYFLAHYLQNQCQLVINLSIRFRFTCFKDELLPEIHILESFLPTIVADLFDSPTTSTVFIQHQRPLYHLSLFQCDSWYKL